MKTIILNIDTMRDALMSCNFNGFVDSLKTKLSEGYVIQVVQEAVDTEPLNLFKIDDFEEFEAWVDNGCPSHK